MKEKVSASKKHKGKKRFPFGRFLAWKTSDVSAAGLNIIVTSYLTLYCTNFLGLPGTVIGTILLVSNVIDAITDLIAGFIVDNTHTKLGKGRPYELGIVGMWICTFIMFSTPTGASQLVKICWVFSMYTFIFGIFNTLRGAGSTAYQIRAFDNDRELLGKVGSYGGIVTTIGSMMVSISFPIAMGRIATSAAGWKTLIAMYSLPLCILALGRFIFVKENPAIDAGQQHVKVSLGDVWNVFTKNKYVWFYAGMIILFNTLQNLSIHPYYYTYIVEDTNMLGIVSIMGILMLPLMLFMPLILKKFSVSKVIMGGAVISIFGYVINFFAGKNISMLLLGSVLTGCLTLPVSYLCIVLLMDLFNYNEFKGLARLEGTTNQIAHGVSSQLGQGLGGFLLGLLLDLGGFVSVSNGLQMVQPESALSMIRLMYSVIPIIIVILLLVCVYHLSKLDDEMPEIEKIIENNRVGA